MSFRKKNARPMPEVSTASLPDIIFMLLFFFMVVTVLRKESPDVDFIIPETMESEKVDENKESAFLYVGKKQLDDESYVVQINNKVVSADKLEGYLNQLLADPAIDRSTFEINMKADRNAPMQLIRQVKLALRKSGIRHLYYMSQPRV